jgi:hypothetical protein
MNLRAASMLRSKTNRFLIPESRLGIPPNIRLASEQAKSICPQNERLKQIFGDIPKWPLVCTVGYQDERSCKMNHSQLISGTFLPHFVEHRTDAAPLQSELRSRAEGLLFVFVGSALFWISVELVGAKILR